MMNIQSMSHHLASGICSYTPYINDIVPKATIIDKIKVIPIPSNLFSKIGWIYCKQPWNIKFIFYQLIWQSNFIEYIMIIAITMFATRRRFYLFWIVMWICDSAALKLNIKTYLTFQQLTFSRFRDIITTIIQYNSIQDRIKNQK